MYSASAPGCSSALPSPCICAPNPQVDSPRGFFIQITEVLASSKFQATYHTLNITQTIGAGENRAGVSLAESVHPTLEREVLKNKKVFLSIDGKSSLSACATTPAESTPDASASRPPSRKRSPRHYARVSPKFHHAKFLLFESRTHSQRISIGERPWTHVYKKRFPSSTVLGGDVATRQRFSV